MINVYKISPLQKTITDDKYGKLQIAWDSDEPENSETWRAIIHYHDKERDEYHHIPLELDEVVGLRNWLGKFILKVKKK